MLKKLLTALVVTLLLPVVATPQWSRTEVDGRSLCERETGERITPSYTSKSYVTVACNILNEVEGWLGGSLAAAQAVVSGPVADPPPGGDPFCPDGFTCTDVGDGACVNIVDNAGSWDITATGTSDSGTTIGFCFIHKTAATESDLHVEFRMVDAPALEDYSQCFAAIREGTDTTDVYFNTFWPRLGGWRTKYDDAPPGVPWTDVTGASDQFLPDHGSTEYDSTADELSGWEGEDGATWHLIGSPQARTLTFPVEYGIGCLSHHPTITDDFTIDNVRVDTTADNTNAGPRNAEPPPTGDNTNVATGTGSFNCQSAGVGPNDTVTMLGTSRGGITFSDCQGALGPETVTNGTFGADSNWTKGTGWTISGGRANKSAGTGSDIDQAITLINGGYYIVEFDVVNYTAGTVVPVVGGTAHGEPVPRNVSGAALHIVAGTADTLQFRASSDFSGAIDNVKLREFRPVWIQNDATQTSQLTINVTSASDDLQCNNCEYVALRGLPWSGAPAGHCGNDENFDMDDVCGIKVNLSSGTGIGSGQVFFTDSSSDFIIQDIEVFGNGAATGPCIQINDHTYTEPGAWRERIKLTRLLLRECGTEGLYVGPNWASIANNNALELRNIEMSYVWAEVMGRESLNGKAWTGGYNPVFLNYSHDTSNEKASGAANFKDSSVHFARNIMSDDATDCFDVEGSDGLNLRGDLLVTGHSNVLFDCASGVKILGSSSNGSYIPTLSNFTIVDISGDCVRTGSGVDAGTISDFICAATGGLSLGGGATGVNNRTGTGAAQAFVNYNGNDFRLTSASPACDDGSNSAPGVDLAGVTRPQGAANDQGAYEFVGTCD